MDVPPGFDPTVILWLNLAGTFVFGLSGGLAAVHARLDFFGVLVLAAVVGLAGGVMRDLLIGVPPATFRDWEYLAVVAAAGLVSFFAHSTLERIDRGVQVFDAIGLSVFCVTGATKAIMAHHRAMTRSATAPMSGSGRSHEMAPAPVAVERTPATSPERAAGGSARA